MLSKEEKFKAEINLFALQAHGGVVTTKGTSMLPLIENGTRVELRPILPQDIYIGDIIAFRPRCTVSKSDDLIAHRVVGITKILGKRFFLMKGDNDTFVELINNEQVIGKVSHIFGDSNLEIALDKIPTNQPKPIFFFIYFLLLKLKRNILGIKGYKFSSALSFGYWRMAKKLSKTQ